MRYPHDRTVYGMSVGPLSLGVDASSENSLLSWDFARFLVPAPVGHSTVMRVMLPRPL